MTGFLRCTTVIALAFLMAHAPAWAQTAGTMIQWGDTSGGQASALPPAAERFTHLSAGYFHSAGLRADGSLLQWGDSTTRQLVGAPLTTERFTAISCGGYHTLALRADGSLVQWGDTMAGQALSAPLPTARFLAVSAGAFHSIGLRTDGTVQQWGATSSNQTAGLPLVTGVFSAVTAGAYHGLALRADGSWTQWGDTTRNQLSNQPLPSARFATLVAGFSHNLALRSDGSLVQWGDTGFSQNLNAPLAVERFVMVAGGTGHSVAIRSDGTRVQWGQTGLGQANNAPAGTERFVSLAAGWLHSLAVRGSPGTPVSFNYQGQLTGAVGAADMRFSLFDAPIGGNRNGVVFIASAVPVAANGRVSVLVNLGTVDLSQELWLNIEVSQAGVLPLEALTPRTYLASTPKAGFARSATNAAFSTEASLATTAITAQQAPWTGITGVPSSVANAFSPWNLITGGIGFGMGNVTIGGSSPAAPFKLRVIGDIWCVNLMQTSSAHYKDDIRPLGLGLSTLLGLRPVSYRWNDEAAESVRGRSDLGLIAEEVAALLPDAVTKDAQGRALGIDYSRITVLAVSAIKQQQQTIEHLKSQNAVSDARVSELEAKLTRLEKLIERR